MEADLQVFAGSANIPLAMEVTQYLGIPLGAMELKRFADGEVRVMVQESVRGHDCFVIQPTTRPVNEHLMQLLVIIDALRRASARRITAVIPYYGYARQDRKFRGREPITAKLVANLLTVAGVDRVLTMDLHAGQIQGFFDIPVDHLTAAPLLADYFRQKQLGDVVVVSPDVGGVARARGLAERLGAPLAIIDKRRPEPNVAEVMNVIGRVAGKVAIIMDDIIDTGGTVVEGAEALLRRDARAVYVCCTHAILSGPAPERLEASCLTEVVVTNSVELPPERVRDKIKVLSVAPLFGEAIRRIHADLSVSEIFE
ncbi:MAG TPA: ribose-phosphate pyrophosphokinase [Firmicutes bacterium]|nr:ribose-phosphate pyrophosphokinase [Bacillota bacterium]